MVLDASVLTDFLLGRLQTLDALDRELAGHEHEPLHAPELIEPETLNALRRLVLAGKVSEQRATEAAADLEALRLIRYPHAPLRARVWELRHSLTAYTPATCRSPKRSTTASCSPAMAGWPHAPASRSATAASATSRSPAHVPNGNMSG